MWESQKRQADRRIAALGSMVMMELVGCWRDFLDQEVLLALIV